MLPAALYEEKQQEILSLIAANQWQLKGLSYQKATLEDVFLHHTQEANHV
jgi:transposase